MSARWVVAMSGGVDSSVAAALLAEEGLAERTTVVHNGVIPPTRVEAPEAARRALGLPADGVLFGLFGLLLMGGLMVYRVRGAILISIVATTLLGVITGDVRFEAGIVGLPANPWPLFLAIDFRGLFSSVSMAGKALAVLLVVFVMDFVDTMGTLVGVSAKAGFLDRDGNLPEIEKPMLCDAVATVGGCPALSRMGYTDALTGEPCGPSVEVPARGVVICQQPQA